jgi:alpha-galactosidase
MCALCVGCLVLMLAAAGPATGAANKLAPTPPMGWNSWNAYACDNNAEAMEGVAEFLHNSGLERDGYKYVNSDGCYDDLEGLDSPNTYGVTAPTPQDPETCGAINGRLPNGSIYVNSYRFPPSHPCANNGFKLVGNYVHALGLKLGLYLDASNNWNCEEIPGSYGFDRIDADTLASWGVDYVKADWGCSDSTVPPGSNAPKGYKGRDAAPGNTGFGGPTFSTNPAYDSNQEDTQIKMYAALARALARSARRIVFSIAGAGTVDSQQWGLHLADLDRPTPDSNPNFTATGRGAGGSVVGIVNADAETYDSLTGPDHWIDPDMMQVGNGSLTPTEDRSEMSMFSEMADPLLISTNLCASDCGPNVQPATKAQLALDVAVLGNRRVIAVDQDRRGAPAHIVGTFDGTHLIMSKPLADGQVAVTMFNESTTTSATMSTTAAAVGLRTASKYRLENLWTGRLSTSSGDISATVPPTATVMFRIAAGSHAPWTPGKPGRVKPATVRRPTPWSGRSSANTPVNLMSVACPTKTQCTTVDIFGAATTFNPAKHGSMGLVSIDSGRELPAVSCPVDNLCVAVDLNGNAVRFDPTALTRQTSLKLVDRGGEPTAVACPSRRECVTVDGDGNEVAFNPSAERIRSGRVHMVDPYTYLGSVSCPSATQCTAVGGGGNGGDSEVTFNPTTGKVGPAGVTSIDPATVNGLASVSCPTTTQCTAVDGSGNEVTFNPATGTPTGPGVTPIEGSSPPAGAAELISVVCMSSSQCTAVDESGHEVTFDPTTGQANGAGLRSVDHTWAGLQSVSCAGKQTTCTAVDLYGREVTFNSATGERVGAIRRARTNKHH